MPVTNGSELISEYFAELTAGDTKPTGLCGIVYIEKDCEDKLPRKDDLNKMKDKKKLLGKLEYEKIKFKEKYMHAITNVEK